MQVFRKKKHILLLFRIFFDIDNKKKYLKIIIDLDKLNIKVICDSWHFRKKNRNDPNF